MTDMKLDDDTVDLDAAKGLNERSGGVPCWEYMHCGREAGGVNAAELGVCPAYPLYGRICWRIAGTLCEGKVSGTFANKAKRCVGCPFFSKVMEEEGDNFVIDEWEAKRDFLTRGIK